MSIRATYSFTCAAFAACIAAAGLAGCFSEHAAVTEPSAEELCTGAQPTDVIRIVDFGFSPNTLSVPKGTRVRFVNCGTNQHTSTADANALWDSGLLARYATFSRVFDTSGSFPYHCNPHPFMKGTITVQ